MAVVLPHDVLFRIAKEGRIRHQLLEMDILEAVIGEGKLSMDQTITNLKSSL